MSCDLWIDSLLLFSLYTVDASVHLSWAGLLDLVICEHIT
jgi:hypothetical protein